MRKIIRHLLACCSPPSSSEAAKAQSLDELDKREAAVIEARKATPLTVRHAIFVDAPPTWTPTLASERTSFLKRETN